MVCSDGGGVITRGVVVTLAELRRGQGCHEGRGCDEGGVVTRGVVVTSHYASGGCVVTWAEL